MKLNRLAGQIGSLVLGRSMQGLTASARSMGAMVDARAAGVGRGEVSVVLASTTVEAARQRLIQRASSQWSMGAGPGLRMENRSRQAGRPAGVFFSFGQGARGYGARRAVSMSGSKEQLRAYRLMRQMLTRGMSPEGGRW